MPVATATGIIVPVQIVARTRLARLLCKSDLFSARGTHAREAMNGSRQRPRCGHSN